MTITGTTLRTWLRKAQDEGFAIPQFNYSDPWDMLAIVEAAEEAAAPIVLASISKVVDAFGPDICGAIGTAVMARATVPVIHHLDHSPSFARCKAAIDNGYRSVLIDGSTSELRENIRLVREVLAYASPRDIHVEAEVGRIPGSEDQSNAGFADANLANPDDVRTLSESCAVDSLAVGIGTAHGFYKSRPQIDFERLMRIKSLVSKPLVLHGGTGVPKEDVQRAISLGIAKVNIGTVIRHTYLTSLRDQLKTMGPAEHTADVQAAIRPRIKEVVKGWIYVCMANGKVRA